MSDPMPLRAVSVYVKEETKECDNTRECEEKESAENEPTFIHVKIEQCEWSEEGCVVKEEREEYPPIKEEWEPGLTKAEHEVKHELALSPEGPQPQDIAFALRDKTTLIQSIAEIGKQDPGSNTVEVEEPPHCSQQSDELLVLRTRTIKQPNTFNKTIKKPKLKSLNSAWRTKLKKHNVTTENGPFFCDFCKRQFVKKTNLALHIRIHMGMKQYACNTCNKQYTNSYNLKRHRLIHSEEKPYSCGVCARQFVELRNLNNHVRRHTGEKPYICDVCNKRFSQSYNMSSHRKTHMTPYVPDSVVCKVCDKQLKNKRSLPAHMMSHNGDKPFTCEICKMQFTKMSNLRRHSRVHTGEKPYSCELCTKRYADLRDLTKHKRTHTGDTP